MGALDAADGASEATSPQRSAKRCLLDLRKARRPGVAEVATLGFVWSPYDVVWETRFRELVQYRDEHGHCDVPARWPPNLSLGHWVAAQRARMRKGTLRDDRARRLKAIGLRLTIQPMGQRGQSFLDSLS